MKKSIVSFISLLLVCAIYGQEIPSWTNYEFRMNSFPDSIYVTGFAAEKRTRHIEADEMMDKLEVLAKNQLIESINLRIQSQSTYNLLNLNQHSQESFQKSSSTFSKAFVTGMQTERFYYKKKRLGYVLVYLKKDEVIKSNIGKFNSTITLIETNIKNAKQLSANGEQVKAMDMCYKTLALVKDCEDYITTTIALGGSLDYSKLDPMSVQLYKTMNLAKNDLVTSLDQATENLVHLLHKQLDGQLYDFQMVPLTYEDTKMASPFSYRFNESMEGSLLRKGIKSKGKSRSDMPEKHAITGSYWPEKNGIKIMLVLRELESGRALASAESLIANEWFDNNRVEYEPERYSEALLRQEMLSNNEIIGGGLVVEVWTDKGKDNPIYREDEQMKLYIRVNMPCYVRFIYYLADGMKTLLFDNHYIGEDKVNKVYEIPGEFICSSPFGVETLQCLAQTNTFTPLFTRDVSGYRIIEEDISSVLKKSRGMKLISSEDFKGEAQLILTTMK